MKINLIIFSSELHDKASVLEARSYLFDGLRAFYDINIINSSDYHSLIDHAENAITNKAITILFIASGGTEELFINVFPFIKQPVVLLSDGYHNSFAAANEISTWMDNNDVEHLSFNIPLDADKSYFNVLHSKLEKLRKHILVKNQLKGEKIGLIGGSSSWLIASQIEKKNISTSWGLIFKDISIDELAEDFITLKNSGTNYAADSLVKKFESRLAKDRTKEELVNAVIMYYAIKQICSKYSLSAITIKCFDLIKLCNATPCLAMAILNDEGIVSGCEGDIPSLLTMLMVKKGGHKCSFMVNPSSSDQKNLTVDFSHCTVPLSMTDNYTLPSHFESSIGIGVKGILPLGEYSVVKFGGRNLNKYFFHTGKIVSNPDIAIRCRTQVRFQFNTKEGFDEFMTSSLGNHIILFRGGN